MKSNLTVGNPMAKAQNSPGPISKTKGSNLTVGKPMAKRANSPKAMAKTSGRNVNPNTPSSRAPSMPDEARIRSELMTGKRNNSHSRGGK